MDGKDPDCWQNHWVGEIQSVGCGNGLDRSKLLTLEIVGQIKIVGRGNVWDRFILLAMAMVGKIHTVYMAMSFKDLNC